jgi:serine/threonine-protein kinase
MTPRSPKRSFLGELKRRHVFRVAASYALVAFVVVQAAELLTDALSLPSWTLPFITVLAILGFPIAVVMSWAFELTDEGVRLDALDAAEGGDVAPVGLMNADVGAPGTAPGLSVAVLPFANLSGDEENEYFSDGITEDIINGLSRLRDLRVISRTSVMRYKGSVVPVQQVARELGVATVLEGSVRRADGRVRISAQLIDAVADRHLWVETYDHSLQDIFAIQSDVSSRIAQALAGELSAEEQEDLDRRPTNDVEAYDLYLKGRYLWSRRTLEGIEKSIHYYERALERDPRFALAEAGLADSYVTLGIYGTQRPDELMPLAQGAAGRALAVDSRLAEALTSLAAVRSLYHWDWVTAEEDYRKAIELQPQYPVAHHWYGSNLLTPLGRFDEALAATRRALELDPLGAAVATSLGMIHLYAGNPQAALDELAEVVDVYDHFGMGFYFQGMAWEEVGDHDKALASLKKAAELTAASSEVLAALGHAHARAGDGDAARAILARLEDRFTQTYGSPALLAQIHLGLGDHERALTLLEAAAEERAVDVVWLGVRPTYLPLRGEARFQALQRRVGVGG